jgi:hypothetical protein
LPLLSDNITSAEFMGLGEAKGAFKAGLKERGLLIVEETAIGKIIQDGLEHGRDLGGYSNGGAGAVKGDIGGSASKRARDRFPGKEKVVLVVLAGCKDISGLTLKDIPGDG